MNKSINLLVHEEEKDTSPKRRLTILRYTSLGFLFVIVITAVSLFFLILTSPLPEVRQQEEVASRRLQELRSTSGMLYLVRERLGSISQILKDRPATAQVIEKVIAQTPSGITIEEVHVEAKTLSFVVSSTSLSVINTFITTIQDLKKSDKVFSSIALSELHFDAEDPKYVLTLQTEVN